MTIRRRALPSSFRLAISFLICLAGVISTSSSQVGQNIHVVNGRVQVAAGTQPLKLAESTPISIRANGQKVTSVVAGWLYFVNNTPVSAQEQVKLLPVTYHSDGSAYISVTPLKLGKVQLTLLVSFPDGGVERDTIDVEVGQSTRPPEKLVIALPGGDNRRDTPVISMDLSERNRTEHVFPFAIYRTLHDPVSLNASDVSFKMLSPPTGAADIDPSTGIITARHVGQALLETSFAGVATLTCIDVMKDARVGRASRCEELLPPGRRLPPSAMELDQLRPLWSKPMHVELKTRIPRVSAVPTPQLTTELTPIPLPRGIH